MGEPCRRKPVKLCWVQCFQMDLTRETCQPLPSGLPHLHNNGQHSTKPFGKVHSASTQPTFIEGQACVHPYLYWALKACRTSPSLLVHHLGRREIMHDRYLENNPNVNLDVWAKDTKGARETGMPWRRMGQLGWGGWGGEDWGWTIQNESLGLICKSRAMGLLRNLPLPKKR